MYAHRIAEDVRKGRFPETWRPREKDVIKCLLPVFCGFDSKFKSIADLLLTDEFRKLTWAQLVVKVDVASIQSVARSICRHMSLNSLVDSLADVKDGRAQSFALRLWPRIPGRKGDNSVPEYAGRFARPMHPYMSVDTCTHRFVRHRWLSHAHS